MKTRKLAVIVIAEVPYGVTKKEWQSYVEDAIGTMKGTMPPEDPLRDLQPHLVTCSPPTRISE